MVVPLCVSMLEPETLHYTFSEIFKMRKRKEKCDHVTRAIARLNKAGDTIVTQTHTHMAKSPANEIRFISNVM